MVAFDLEKVVAVFFQNGPRGLFLAVERIGGDGFALQGGQLGQEALGRFEFAAGRVFLLIHDGHGDGRTVLDLDQADRADDIADHLAVQCQCAGQHAGLLTQPPA